MFIARRHSLKATSIIILGIIMLNIVVPTLPIARAPENWWDPNWTYRKQLIIDRSMSHGTLTNFPVMIEITDSDLAARAKSDGSDIAFTTADGVKLSHEIESYASGSLTAWVKVPQLSSTSDTTLYMYYGNPNPGSQQDVNAVWDGNYKMVQHLSGVGTIIDSTSYNNDGQTYGRVTKINGIDDGAIDLYGYNAYAEIPSSSSLNGFSALTLSFWLRLDVLTKRQSILQKYNETTGQKAWMLDYRSDLKAIAFYASSDGTIKQYWYTPYTPSAGTWHHVTVTWVANNLPTFYIDGEQTPTINTKKVGQLFSNTLPLQLGKEIRWGRYLNGALDEVRISNIVRSSNWIQTKYSNELTPGSYITLGDEEISYVLPVISNPIPADHAVGVPTTLSQLWFDLANSRDDPMYYQVKTTPNIGSKSASVAGNGQYSVDVHGLASGTTYFWEVDSTVDYIHWTNVTFSFTTAAAGNVPPIQDAPLLISSGGGNTEFEDLTTFNRSTIDPNGDEVTNVYNWYRNGTSLATLNMPFELNSISTVKSYTPYGLSGTIDGTVLWNEAGVVGGAYTFNGGGHIEVPDNFNLDGLGTWSEITIEAWIKPTTGSGNYGKIIISKKGSYEIGFSDTSLRLYFKIWNNAVFRVDTAQSTVLVANKWYHVVFTYKELSGSNIYVNGSSLTLNAPSWAQSGKIDDSNSPLAIGGVFDDSSTRFRGFIDGVKIYPSRLYFKQIEANYLDSRYGASSSSTLVSEQIRPQNVWRCEVTPSDGKADGTTRISNSLQVMPGSHIITHKWTKSAPSTGRGVVLSDLNGDGRLEVIIEGNGIVKAYNGADGIVIWSVSVPGANWYAQLQIADLNMDGSPEIIVPVGQPYDDVGLHVLYANGATYWRYTNKWGQLTSAPVVGDVIGDDHPEIFVGTTDIYRNPVEDYTSVVAQFSYDGRLMRTTRVWRLCAGGLSLADTDHDGRFELYGGDRSENFGDGGFGRGVISWWADDLTLRWNVTDVLTSSNIPMLADVNKDGTLDVIAVHHRGGLVVLNSRDGSPIRKSLNLIQLGGHYQQSAADIDLDGNLEILMADGDHDSTTNDVVVWDLVRWREEYRIYLGLSFYGPNSADVNGDGRLEMIASTLDGVYIIDNSFKLIDRIEDTVGKLNYAVVGDIDGDGLNEIVISSQSGKIYAFDTLAPAPIPPARTWVQFYSERRLGAAEYVPYP